MDDCITCGLIRSNDSILEYIAGRLKNPIDEADKLDLLKHRQETLEWQSHLNNNHRGI